MAAAESGQVRASFKDDPVRETNGVCTWGGSKQGGCVFGGGGDGVEPADRVVEDDFREKEFDRVEW